MTPAMYVSGAALVLLALAFPVLPLLRHRREQSVGITLTGTVILLPLAAVLIYGAVSNYPWDEMPVATVPSEAEQPAVDEMITELAKRLETQPDLEGFVLLGRSYMSLQRYADAVDAWHRAWELSEGKAPEISLNYAEALILADKRTLKTSAVDLLDSALNALPDEPRALWYGGLSAAERQLNDLAVERFTRLLQAELPDEMRKVVQTQLAQLGATPATAMQQTAAEPEAENAAAVIITATVSIANELAARVPSGAMLFLFARDGDKPGPPVAVKRLSAAQLPLTATLTNADAMVPGSDLARVSELKLVARISASGNAIAAPGDLYGEARPDISTGENQVSVVIDRVVE